VSRSCSFRKPTTFDRLTTLSHESRRRKTKCNGIRPACGGCVSRRVPCVWPMIQPQSLFREDVETNVQTPEPHSEEVNGTSQKRLRLSHARPARERGPLSSGLCQRALAVFYERHHAVECCSFLHVPSLDIDSIRRQSPFFAHALISLSSMYFTDEEAAKDNFETPRALSEWHAVMAREFSRRCADSPSSTYSPQIIS
jgi:hypothetical protein